MNNKKCILSMLYNKHLEIVYFTEEDNKGHKREQSRKVINGSFKWNNKMWTIESWKECLLDECYSYSEIY